VLNSNSPAHPDVSREARLYAERAARSISEIQGNISSVTDILVFLEVLGYDDHSVSQYGFADLTDFARYIFDFLDFVGASSRSEQATRVVAPQQKRKGSGIRFLEGLALAFPMVGMLAVLFVFGVSLWMARVLPVEITTAFLSGVFLGLLISEGPLQAFNRLFSFYYSQNNLGEVKRTVRRNDYFVGSAVLMTSVVLLFFVFAGGLPLGLVLITIFSSATIAAHRSSYLTIFALKKLGQMVAAYALALIAVVLIYLYSPAFLIGDVMRYIPPIVVSGVGPATTFELVLRYFLALFAAFLILSVPALYYRSKIMTAKTTDTKSKAPHFYAPSSIGDNTVRSRLGVQLWETLPYFIFGTFFFLMVFADRIISWVFNPLVATYGTLPLEFNAAYHTGADPALIILLATTIVSYVLLSPIYDELGSSNSRMTVAKLESVEVILQNTYNKLLLVAVLISTSFAFLLNYEGLVIMHYLRGGVISLQILRVASIGDVFISVFFVNAMFLTLVSRVKVAATISVVCVLIVVILGTFFGLVGFQDIIWAYLLSAFVSMIASTLYCISIRGRFSDLFLSRYV
jgi:hypothetical protein